MNAQTLEADNIAGTSYATLRGLHIDTNPASQPSSPRSSTLPSPPDSPDSISSFPSLSSSFFFSSAAASPPHAHADLPRDSTEALIIPSLTLPAALRQSTVLGKTLGKVRLIVLGSLSGHLLDTNEDVVDVTAPEPAPVPGGRIVRASTDWVEHRDAHGFEQFEPTHNIEILEISWSNRNDNLAEDLLSIICKPFHDLHALLDRAASPSPLLSSLVASPTSPLYTAFIVLSSGLSTQERALIDTLGTHIPVILLPPTAGAHTRHRLPLSSFRPLSVHALRAALFRSPGTLALLRSEAAERFFQWRPNTVHSRTGEWDKGAWEEEWDRRRQPELPDAAPRPLYRAQACTPAPLDPLHLPSLLFFSLSLLTPLRTRIGRTSLSGKRLSLVILGTLCAGIGIGLALRP